MINLFELAKLQKQLIFLLHKMAWLESLGLILKSTWVVSKKERQRGKHN
jgi:hypothetical protein